MKKYCHKMYSISAIAQKTGFLIYNIFALITWCYVLPLKVFNPSPVLQLKGGKWVHAKSSLDSYWEEFKKITQQLWKH